MAVNEPRYDVRIEELVLHGFPVAHRERIVAALEAELARLVAREGVSASRGGHLASISVPPIQLGGKVGPAAVGRRIARALHGGLAR